MPPSYLLRHFTTGTPFSFSAIRKGSSPASTNERRGPSPLVTKQGPFAVPLYPRVRTTGESPLLIASSATAITAGVLPVPPTVIFPILITLQGRRLRFLRE